jgi:hypothetical protein
MMTYAGIGNRTISEATFDWLEQMGTYLASRGLHLRSGGADGADTAFERGSKGNCTIFKAKQATPEAIQIASQFHPAWHMCSDWAQKLHGRNAMILLGQNLDFPVKFVICYTVDEEKGGTALGIRIARAYGIPVFNMHQAKDYEAFTTFVRTLKAA